MTRSLTQLGRDAITGADRSVMGHLFRAVAAAAEPAYTTVLRTRNLAYDRGWSVAHDLGRPTVSVGNLTTGGTGKTPVVRWLVDHLRDRGRRPAVLMRGYKGTAAAAGDEQLLLQQMLGHDVPVMANPSRVDGAVAVLRDRPDVDLFVLDDGFQHRRARRDVDLVLVSATDPFGGGRVLPRGLLREPMAGLARATAFILSRCGLVADGRLNEIGTTLLAHNPAAPIFRCDADLVGADVLTTTPFYAVAGIGDPDALDVQLRAAGDDRYVGWQWFADHHRYTAADVRDVSQRAVAAGARAVVTTEKDWVKLGPIVGPDGHPPFVPVGQRLRFRDGDDALLVELVERLTETRRRPGRD